MKTNTLARTETAAPAAHTPTPWRVGDCGRTVFGPKTSEPSPVTIASSDSTRTTTAEKRANVALIVAAVNAHAGLVASNAALLAALALCETRLTVAAKQSGTRPATRAEFRGAAEIARAALAQGGGK